MRSSQVVDNLTPAEPTLRPARGVLMVCLAVFFFALSDVVGKQLMMRYPVPVVAAVRYGISLVLLLALFGPSLGSSLWRTERTALVLVRGVILTLATLTLGLALRVMPVGETIAIMYLSPFAVMLLAIPLLGERVSRLGWLLALAGFTGVLLIVRPGSGLPLWGVVFALSNAALATAFHLLTRLLTRTESTLALLFHVTLIGAISFAIAATPDLRTLSALPLADLALMGLLGVMATSGHFLLTAAYREAPASLIAPMNYLHLVWAGVLGWLVFGHRPDHISLTGMALIVSAGAGTAWLATRRPRNSSN